MKKTLWILILALVVILDAQAGMVVGRDKIEVIQDNYTERLNIKDPIVLTKPSKKDGIQLVSYEDFLKRVENPMRTISPKLGIKKSIKEESKEKTMQGEEIFDAVSSAKEDVSSIVKIEKEEAPKEVIVKETPIKETVYPDPEIKVHAIKDLHIYYDTSMKTFLSRTDKEKLKEIVKFAEDNNLNINIIASASGKEQMAERVALLRANIIKSTLKGYGLADDKMQVKSLGSSINEDVAKVFLVK